MPRRPRHFATDSIFHVCARGVDRQPIFLTDSDRKFFIDKMETNLRASNLRSVAWCLMPNHFHWGIATAARSFEMAIHDTLTAHAVRFNRLHGRTGHLFEGRHWSSHCDSLDHIENMVVYMHLNPVRAKIVKRPEEWRWSSHGDWAVPRTGNIDFARIEAITGRSEKNLRLGYSARLALELSGGPRSSDVDGLITDTASMLGISETQLRAGARGEEFTRAKRILIARATREKIALQALAERLNCTPESLYLLRQRHPNKSA